MNTLISLVGLIFVIWLVLRTGKPSGKKSRQQFLREMTEFLEGTLEPIEEEGFINSFRVRCEFKGSKFTFDHVEQHGFKDKLYTGYLRLKTSSPLTLVFSEKKRSLKIRSEVFIASAISTQDLNRFAELHMPAGLDDLTIYSSDTMATNKILEDKKIVALLKKFKNIDARGYPFLSLIVHKGEVTLEFYSSQHFKPNLNSLEHDIPTIEDHMEKILVFANKLLEVT